MDEYGGWTANMFPFRTINGHDTSVEDLLSLKNCKHNVPGHMVDTFIGVFFFNYSYGLANILRVIV